MELGTVGAIIGVRGALLEPGPLAEEGWGWPLTTLSSLGTESLGPPYLQGLHPRKLTPLGNSEGL